VSRQAAPPGLGGLVIVDKPAGMSSHAVVARVRRLAGTRRVGHAGTLDPMATGVLVLGVERATRVLGHLALTDKDYTATIRLGQSTVTDDAEGEIVTQSSAAAITLTQVRDQAAILTGDLMQRPASVSAIKVDGARAYTRVRSGEHVELAARPVHVARFAVVSARRPDRDLLDVDVEVTCSTGTYVRALARDVGEALGVGGHLAALRRTRSGSFTVAEARTLDSLEADFAIVPLAEAVAREFTRVDVGEAEAHSVLHGGRLDALRAAGDATGPYGVFGPDGAVLALMERRDGSLRPLAVFG
jgi:tRNA pseudouridine55 synthase